MGDSGRVAALDGLRGLSIAGVLAMHAQVPGMTYAGIAGVQTFFVLSGYVITRGLARELEASGRLNLRAFYGRRAVRLGPAMLLSVAAVLVLYQALGVGFWLGVRQAVPGLLYYANVYQARGDGDELGAFQHMWTLSFEEQFYVVWPLLLAAVVWRLRRPVLAVALAGVLIVVAEVTRPLGLHTLWVLLAAGGLSFACGCALALAVHRGFSASRWLLWPGLAVFAAVSVGAPPDVLAPVGGLLLVASCTAGHRAVEARPLVGLGRISYGVYLWNGPLFALLGIYGHSVGLRATIAAVSVGLAAVSFRYVETPISAAYRARVTPSGSGTKSRTRYRRPARSAAPSRPAKSSP